MKLLFLLLLSAPVFLQAQDSTDYFLKNRCKVAVDGSGEALGVKVNYSSPCLWTKETGTQPDMIRVFKHDTGNGVIVSNLIVRDLGVVLQQSDMDEFFSESTLEQMAGQIGSLITAKVLQIDGRPCGEVKLTTQAEGSPKLYHAFYYFIVGDKMIVKSYSVTAANSARTEELFNVYQGMFAKLADTVKFE